MFTKSTSKQFLIWKLSYTCLHTFKAPFVMTDLRNHGNHFDEQKYWYAWMFKLFLEIQHNWHLTTIVRDKLIDECKYHTILQLPVSMCACPIAWIVNWLSPFFSRKKLLATSLAFLQPFSWSRVQRLTMWFTVCRAWTLLWSSSGNSYHKIIQRNVKNSSKPYWNRFQILHGTL